MILCGLPFLSLTQNLFAQSASDKKKTALAGVKRVLLTLPYFATPEFLDNAPVKVVNGGRKLTDEEIKKVREENRLFLSKLESQTQETLQKRLTVRTPFTVSPLKLTLPASRDPKEKKQDKEDSAFAFKGEGRLKGTKFPLPNPVIVRQLATENNADAVLLTIMDEPRRDDGGYFFDASGIGYRSPHVSAKIALYFLLADGTEILHEYVEVLHPISKIGNRDYTQVDMTETHEMVIENFLDELTRYLPKP